jgi:signal transduction histidine kinase
MGLLLRLIARIEERPFFTAAVGIALELAIMTAVGTDDSIAGVRGIGGETAVSLAVIGALFAGPLVGVAMALAGWAVFFPTIADSRLSSVIALPEWTVTAFLAGLLSRGIVELERQRIEAARDLEAAHALRAPIATIRGLVDFLGHREAATPEEEKVVRALGDETDRLLRSPLLDRPSPAPSDRERERSPT